MPDGQTLGTSTDAVQVEGQQQSAIPTENKPTAPQTQESDPILPDGVSERTSQEFDKLKAHNKELKDKLAQYEQPKQRGSVLDELRPQQQFSDLSQTQVDDIAQNFVDENGYVDVAALTKTLKEANDEAKRARVEAQQARELVMRYEETDQMKRAHQMFPELDPGSQSFDERFYELVKNELIGQMMRGEKDVVKAAQKTKDLYTSKPTDDTKAKEEAVNEYKRKVTQREQATDQAGGRGQSDLVDHDELVRRTRKGDRDALNQRLKASGY